MGYTARQGDEVRFQGSYVAMKVPLLLMVSGQRIQLTGKSPPNIKFWQLDYNCDCKGIPQRGSTVSHGDQCTKGHHNYHVQGSTA